MRAIADHVRSGDLRALARALSAVENRARGTDSLLEDLYAPDARMLRFGVTGAPGVGKSTLVDCLVRRWRAAGRTVAVLAVDPSSPFSGGAILGDRVRMQQHHTDPGVFIRSMASRGELGGLAQAVDDALTVLEAAGRDIAVVETAGVGQSEVDIVRVAGTVAVVLTPMLGDDVQAAKAGILEIADIFVVNKADQPGADELERQLGAMISLIPPEQPKPPIVCTVASRCGGVAALKAALDTVGHRSPDASYWRRRLLERIGADLQGRLARANGFARELDSAAAAVADGTLNPYGYARQVLDRLPEDWRP